MPLDRQVTLLLDTIASLNLPELHTLTAAEGRAMARMQRESLPPGPDAEIRDVLIPGPAGDIPARVYRPHGTGSKVLPVLMWFHGGGFVIGSVHESDSDCRRLAVDSNVVVVSVEYRLAPEHPFPAGPEDCYAATAWVAAHASELRVDASRLAVGGDSAGGNLATVVALMARDRGGPPIAFQLLVYPVTDLASMETPSHHANAVGYYLTRASMMWFREAYVPDASGRMHGHVSPLHAPDLGGLPPALVITAEFDPLRDEGEIYADRLRAAGVSVTRTRHDGMIHGFFSMNEFLQGGRRAMTEAVNALRGALS
ncbi:MAG TPA: alpha/beta hydrolase [Polyangiaceae bacterium]